MRFNRGIKKWVGLGVSPEPFMSAVSHRILEGESGSYLHAVGMVPAIYPGGKICSLFLVGFGLG